ncbi:MAG TPA: class I adenylate-forming enzyme family protein [Methylomirabilota bacterium]|nr:class I adenylate-forming enzyme family protein [Methylomirabilota bacterium]
MSTNVGSLVHTLSPRGSGQDDGWSSRVAIIDLSRAGVTREITYAELDAQGDAVAAGLAARGVGRGARVGILALNRPEYIAALYGVMRAGAIPVPLNVKLPAESLAFIAKDAGVSLLFVDTAHRPVAPAVAMVDFDADYAEFLKPGPVEAVPPDAGDVCLQPYTSGSTGRPKGVLLTHGGQAWQIEALVRARRMTPEDRVLVAAPLYHKNALVWTKVCLAAGASIVLLARFDQRLYVESIGRHRVTRLSGVPTMFHLILGDPALAAVDKSSVRAIGVGSAPASPALFEALHRTFPNAVATNGYGVTEAGPVMFANHPQGTPRPAASIGYPLEGCEVRLDPGPDEGVLLTRNPGVMAGYHNLPEETARRLKDGWFDTGDVCRRDADGFYYFVGRTDDMFVCGGENVYPGEVEGTLERHPDILQAAVLPVDHALKGQVPVAFVVARPDAALTEQAVKAWALAHGPAYQHPRRVFLVSALPLAGTNKIDRAALKARALAVPDPTRGG